MLFERPSEVSSFNRYMLPGIANKTDQRSLLFRYLQQCVTGPVGQQSPFVNGNNGVLQLRAFLRSEQKRFAVCTCPSGISRLSASTAFVVGAKRT